MPCLTRILLLQICVVAFASQTLAQSNVVLSEVFYAGTEDGGETGDWVEITNLGNAAADVSGWFLCSHVNYGRIGNRVIISGDDYVLQPGEVLVVEAILDISGNRLSDTAADLGLYSAPIFAEETAMVDFIKYGDSFGFGGRQSVARDAGLWLEVDENVYDFVPPVADGETVQYCGNGARMSVSSEFVSDVPSPGVTNDCGKSPHLFSAGFESSDLGLWSTTTSESGC